MALCIEDINLMATENHLNEEEPINRILTSASMVASLLPSRFVLTEASII